MGIIKGSSGGRVELIPQKPQGAGSIERLNAPEEIKVRGNVPDVDMFSRKREGVMPQPEIPGTARPFDRPKPGAAEPVQMAGLTFPQTHPNVAESPGASPSFPRDREGGGQLFP